MNGFSYYFTFIVLVSSAQVGKKHPWDFKSIQLPWGDLVHLNGLLLSVLMHTCFSVLDIYVRMQWFPRYCSFIIPLIISCHKYAFGGLRGKLHSLTSSEVWHELHLPSRSQRYRQDGHSIGVPVAQAVSDSWLPNHCALCKSSDWSNEGSRKNS